MNIRIIPLIFVFSTQLINTFSQDILRAIEGQWDKVEIDTTTPLDSLINRLKLPWNFVETGKGYWIGYTDDMFSIAHHKDKAINPLINLIDNTDTLKTKIGALYTLHLIGIDSKIAGRLNEEFNDTLARQALISYLNDNELHQTVLLLLMRDPWPSDIPYFMDYLSIPENEYIMILSALQRYEFDNKPFGQKLSDDVYSMEINIKTNSPHSHNPILYLIALQKKLDGRIFIDNEVVNSKEWMKGEQSLKTADVRTEKQYLGVIIEYLTNTLSSYISFDNRYFYIFKDEIITIYGPEKAREIWLDWWNENNVKNINGS